MQSGLKPVITFAKRLSGYVEGIVASALYRLNTSFLEGMNNRIKVIKRIAYGYRDSAYFFLKIKAAFPGKTRRTFFCCLPNVDPPNDRMNLPPVALG